MYTLTQKPLDFFKKAAGCSQYYGFYSLDDLEEWHRRYTDPTLLKRPKGCAVLKQTHKKVDTTSRELESAARQLALRKVPISGRPLLFYTSNVDPYALKDGAPLPKTINFALHAVGMKASIAEALVLKTAHTILEDMGEIDICTYLNCIGDRDSSAKFSREATAHLRKHINILPPQIQQAFKEDVFLAYSQAHRKHIEFPEEMPRPMEFLTSASRKHLREVLEFLEAADIPYVFDDGVIGHRDCYTQTLFEIRNQADDLFSEKEAEVRLYARGGRYDELLRQYFKTNVSGVGLVFSFKPADSAVNIQRVTVPRTGKQPRVYFIQIGYAAQLRSFAIIEAFRQARIPLEQSLEHQQLSEQLAYAEKSSIPYTVIMGQKEALEGSVIVRDTSTRAQQTVAVDMLPSFFK